MALACCEGNIGCLLESLSVADPDEVRAQWRSNQGNFKRVLGNHLSLGTFGGQYEAYCTSDKLQSS